MFPNSAIMEKKSPSNSTEGSQKWIIRGVLAAIVLTPFIVFPPLRCTSPQAAQATNAFNARDLAAKFWNEKLLPHLSAAYDAREVDAAIAAGPKAAAQKYARVVGIGGTSYYFLAGVGTVTNADDDSVTVDLGGDPKDTLVLDTGLVFGNAV